MADAEQKLEKPEKGTLENVDIEIVDGTMVIDIDTTQRLRRTKEGKGKSMVIGTTNGFHTLKNGMWVTLIVGIKESAE